MKKTSFHLLTIVLTLSMMLWSCDSMVYDKMSDCPQGVYLSFYNQTYCASAPSYVGSQPSLIVFAFDQEGTLVSSISRENVNLNEDFSLYFPISNGNYNFVAWAGALDLFNRSTFTPGTSKKKDVILTLRSQQGVADLFANTDHVWQGESPMVSLPDPAKHGSVFKHTSINLRELTNRIKIEVEFDQVTMKEYDPTLLQVAVSSANTTYHFDGSMAYQTPVVDYPAQGPEYTANTAKWQYNLLDLQTGHYNILNLTYLKDGVKETVFDGDLIASLLLRAVEGGVNLDCDNDFAIKFVIKDYCVECWTHFSCSIYVNNWLVHSYETELGGI